MVEPRIVERAPHSMTHLGFAIEISSTASEYGRSTGRYQDVGTLQLNCRHSSEKEKCLAISLLKRYDYYEKVALHEVDKRPIEGLKTVYIKQESGVEIFEHVPSLTAIRFHIAFAKHFQSAFTDLPYLRSRRRTIVESLKFQKIDQITNTFGIEPDRTIVLACTDRCHDHEVLGIVIHQVSEIPYVDVFFINDFTKIGEVVQQRLDQTFSRYEISERSPRPDRITESLPCGTKISVVLKRAIIADNIHNIVELNLE